jgi:hypothetical protein
MPDVIRKEYYNSTRPEEKQDSRWWLLDEELQYQSVFTVVKNIETKQVYRSTQNIRHARLYSNLDILSLSVNTFASSAMDLDLQNKMTYNVVKSCIDTAASKIAKMRPRPLFLTEGGDWALQRKAKQLTKFIDGSFDQMDIYTKSQRVFTDSGVWGTGFFKFFIKDDEYVDCERVIAEETVVDDAEGVYGQPMQMFQKKMISRDVLLAMFPDSEADIRQCQSTLTVEQAASRDFLKVIEAWRLPSSKGAKDGAHCICINNKTLMSEPWTKQRFPFASYRWSPKLTGYYGMGLAEELLPIQMEINKLLRRIQRSMHLMCVPRVFINQASAINTQHLNNDDGSIVKYNGEPPTFNTAPAMPAEVYQHLQALYDKAFEITGVSQMNATAQKPAGLNSGEAQRVYQDITSERFQLQGMRWEDLFMDAADIVIDLTKDLAKKNKNLEVKLSSGKHAETIKWSEVALPEDKYVMRKFPTSILPTEPAGKLQKVQELAQAGMIDKDTAYSLLDFPDLEGAKSIQLETQDLTKKMVMGMLEDQTYMSPEPYMDASVAQKIAQAAYLNARNNDMPDDRLELLRRFMQDCEALKSLQMQGQPPPPGAPGAVPAPPPVSDLLPNAPGGAPQGAA